VGLAAVAEHEFAGAQADVLVDRVAHVLAQEVEGLVAGLVEPPPLGVHEEGLPVLAEAGGPLAAGGGVAVDGFGDRFPGGAAGAEFGGEGKEVLGVGAHGAAPRRDMNLRSL
jgi:hypothetical protein